MKRIICHWTAGTHAASDVDKQHYHYLIEGGGKVVTGKWPVSANEKIVGGNYAAHTLNCNTGSIGVSLCCMAGATESPFSSGKWPMTKTQWDAMVALVADLASKYKIPVTPQTILSHAEVQGTLGIAQRGKWDFTRLSWSPETVGAKACGDLLRSQVVARMASGGPPAASAPAPMSGTAKLIAALTALAAAIGGAIAALHEFGGTP